MARLIHLLACLAALTPALSGPFSSPGRELLAASDKELHAGGIWAKVIGQSGKIDLAPSQDVSSDPNKIRVQIEALRQKDSAGNVLGSGGNAKHSFNSFATQDFAFGALEDTSYGGVTCVKLPFTATLAPGSKIEIHVFLFKENGTITVGADKFAVTNSTMKFNVLLSNWVWCSNNGVCKGTDGVGASVELDFSVTSKEAAKKSPNATGLLYSLGGGARMRLSDKIQLDGGSWTQMPGAGPTLTGTDKISKFTLKFPRFNSTALYDPDITYGTSSSSAETQVALAETPAAFNPVAPADDTSSAKTKTKANSGGRLQPDTRGKAQLAMLVTALSCLWAASA